MVAYSPIMKGHANTLGYMYTLLNNKLAIKLSIMPYQIDKHLITYAETILAIFIFTTSSVVSNVLLQLLAVELTDCSKEVNYQYFSHERKFPIVCYTCGGDISSSSSGKQMHEEKQSDMIIHDVCQTCKDRGIKPRTRKKKPAASKKKSTDKQSNSGLLF